MGMNVQVYRNSLGDCTNGGISAEAHGLCIVNCDGPSQPSELYPAAFLEISKQNVLRLVPAEERPFGDGWKAKPGWFMNGGNFAYTSDQRFGLIVLTMGGQRGAAIPIFDRLEG